MARGRLSLPRSVLLALVLGGVAGCAAPPEPGGAGHESEEDHAFPPAPPEGAAEGDGPGVVLAITGVRLGRNAPSGAPDADAWREIGYDLDGVITDDAQHRTCAPAAGATFEAALLDGDAGRDNAFGKSVLPMIEVLAGSAEGRTNDDILNGKYTTLIRVEGLGRAPEYSGLSAHLYEAAPAPAPLAGGGEDLLSPTFESVQDGDPSMSLAPIRDSYVRDDGGGGTWVGSSEGVVTLRVAMNEEADPDKVVRLSVHRPLVAVRFDEDRETATGTLTGHLRPGE